ncbi:MAG: hypothetical protein ACYC28_14935 [Longimicrobiales bacterium]
MARNKTRPRSEPRSTDRARDELFSAIRQCGVIDAQPEEQSEWMEDTLQFMKERYPDLTENDVDQLRELGIRFCQPVIPHGGAHTALNTQEEAATAA